METFVKVFPNGSKAGAAWRLSPVAAGCAALFCAAAPGGNALAQAAGEQADAAVSTVRVTGIRRGIEDAISVKKDATSIVEAISAEDIGKLPDISIAESIARLPGLAAQRVAGRAQVISVRGLSPDFATTTLNGREQVSTGDNRSVEFDQYPSELLGGVTVYKTPDAALVGQGLSGTLDLQAVRPLNFGGRTVALNARTERNSLGKQGPTSPQGNRFSASYIDQYLNRTLGLAIGYAHLESPVVTQETGMYEPWNADSRPGLAAGLYNTGGSRSGLRTGFNRRDGVMAVLQYRPNREWNSTLDVYASRSHGENTSNRFEFNLGDYNGGLTPGLQYTNVTTTGNTFASGLASNVYPLVRGVFNRRKDDIRALGWNTEWRLKGVKLVADLSYSTATRDEFNIETNLQRGATTSAAHLDNIAFQVRPGQFPQMVPGRSYEDPSQLYVKNSIYGVGYGTLPRVDDEMKSARLSATFDAPAALESWVSSFDVGINRTDRNKERGQPEAGVTLPGGNSFVLPQQYITGSIDVGFAGVGRIPVWNTPALVADRLGFVPTTTESYLIPKQWTVDETIDTAFFRANLEHEFGAATLRGNVGVQVQHTDQSSRSNYWDNTAPAGQNIKPTHNGKSYTDVLPSLNLALSFDHEQTLRVGLAQQLARPRVDQLRSALDFGVDRATGRPGGSGGNTELDPWKAKAFDLSYEKYFGKRAYVAAAFFFKKLDTYIYTQTRDYDFSAYTPGTPARTPIGQYSAPFNGNGGTLRGLELSASLPLGLVAPALDGFGVVASTNYNDSAIQVADPASGIGSNIPLPGLSKRTSNLTAYYEKNGFETRISMRRRSDFVGEIANFSAERILRYVAAENVIDLQMGYNFDSGALKGLGFLLQVNNLRNEPYETYNAVRSRQGDFSNYGRTILLGANYKF
jgi:TonB-dependent receptor